VRRFAFLFRLPPNEPFNSTTDGRGLVCALIQIARTRTIHFIVDERSMERMS
jgi:hypothetical protein